MPHLSIPVYSDQDLSPRAADVIRTVVNESFPEYTISFTPWAGERRVLSFGKPSADIGGGIDVVQTYSIAQVMSKANSASVISAAIRLFITEPVPPTFVPQRSVSVPDLEYFDFTKPTAIDIETNGKLGDTHTPEEIEIISVAFYQAGRPPMVITNYFSNKDGCRPLGYGQIHLLRELLPQFEKAIYHNGKFDIRVLNRVLNVQLVNWFDTMLAHHTLNHGAGDHKLKTVARRLLGAPEWEADIKKNLKRGDYSTIPVDKLVEYNGWDVYWTYELYKLFAPMIEASDDYIKTFEFEMTAAEFLLDVENYGIPLDVQYINEYSNDLQLKAKNTRDFLRGFTGDENFNPGSWQQVKRQLATYGHQVTSTDDDHLKELLAKTKNQLVVIFCQKLLAYRKAMKLNGTYANGWLVKSRNGRVHPTYLVHGTTTGRLSSTSPNAQNVPRDKTIRKIVRTLNG